MSRNLTVLFFNSLRGILNFDKDEPIRNIFEFGLKSSIITVGITTHLIYTLSTTAKDKSIITKKYKMVRNGFTDFMVIDNKGRHFNVNNSLWFWKWNSIEDWYNIKEGDELYFKYYGWRVPFLGFFPNIYMTSKDNLPPVPPGPIKFPHFEKSEIKKPYYEIIL